MAGVMLGEGSVCGVEESGGGRAWTWCGFLQGVGFVRTGATHPPAAPVGACLSQKPPVLGHSLSAGVKAVGPLWLTRGTRLSPGRKGGPRVPKAPPWRVDMPVAAHEQCSAAPWLVQIPSPQPPSWAEHSPGLTGPQLWQALVTWSPALVGWWAGWGEAEQLGGVWGSPTELSGSGSGRDKDGGGGWSCR